MFLVRVLFSISCLVPSLPSASQNYRPRGHFPKVSYKLEAMGNYQPLQCCFCKNIFLCAKEDPVHEESLSPQGREQLLLSLWASLP